MTNNFIQIDEKGNYFVITTGWNELRTGVKNYTGQYDFPKENTSVNGLKNITAEGIENNGVTIVNENSMKRVSIRKTITAFDDNGEQMEIDNEFYLSGESVPFDLFFDWLMRSTGVTTINTI